PLVAAVLRLLDGRREVPLVGDRAPESGQAIADAGDPERRRTHVDATAIATEIERHADDVNRLHFLPATFTVTDIPSSPGLTIVVIDGPDWMAVRKSRISLCLLTTLCARKRPPTRTRGNVRSKNRL